MKSIILFLTTLSITFAQTYMAQIQPYKKTVIKSEVAGKVRFVNEAKEFSLINNNKLVVALDSKEEDLRINSYKKSLVVMEKIYKLRQQNAQSKARVRQLSLFEKNNEALNALAEEKNIIDTKRELALLQIQKDKKSFAVHNAYLGEIFVQQDAYVNVGENILECYDFSKSKIELFVQEEELQDIANKSIYINNKKSNFIIEKTSKVRDSKRISTYLVKLVRPNQHKDIYFGKPVRVEFR